MNILRFVKDVLVRCLLVLVAASVLPVIVHVLSSPSILTTIVVGTVSVISVIFSTLYLALTTLERDAILNLIFSRIKK